MDLSTKRIIVTDGAGFLGWHLIKKLQKRGCEYIFVPHIEECDLTRLDDLES